MQEIKLVPSFSNINDTFIGVGLHKIGPLDFNVSHNFLVSYLYLLFAIVGLVSVALIFHWFRYGLSGVFATVVTIVYSTVTISLFGYLLSVILIK